MAQSDGLIFPGFCYFCSKADGRITVIKSDLQDVRAAERYPISVN